MAAANRTAAKGAALHAIALMLIFAPDAHAYIDPGTGSYLFQILVASVLGLAYGVKLHWLRLKTFVVHSLRRSRRSNGE